MQQRRNNEVTPTIKMVFQVEITAFFSDFFSPLVLQLVTASVNTRTTRQYLDPTEVAQASSSSRMASQPCQCHRVCCVSQQSKEHGEDRQLLLESWTGL